jgi:hypothetical protein
MVALALLLPLSVAAQEAQRRQYENMPTTPGLGTPATPNISFPEAEDEEIGKQFLLKRRIAVPQFSLSGDTQYFYSSNPRLLDGDASDDFLFVGSATVAWNPTWIKGVNVNVYGRQQYLAIPPPGLRAGPRATRSTMRVTPRSCSAGTKGLAQDCHCPTATRWITSTLHRAASIVSPTAFLPA